MRYEKRYVQFNDLVFDTVDMLSSDDLTISFKRKDTEYTYRHGSYVPHRTRGMLAEAANFSMTITLRMKRLPCEYRKYYPDFAKTQLAQIGRLWAVSNNTLLWAWAELKSFGEATDPKRDTVEYDVDVYLPEGVWHKADTRKTFLHPWDICDFMQCYHFEEEHNCGADGDCCGKCSNIIDAGCDCCICNGLTEDMALCHHTNDLQVFYSCTGSGYRIVYDCDAADRFSDDYRHWQGHKLCATNGIISGKIYSGTDLESTYVKIYIDGKTKNPRITINGNTNVIKGEYEKLLINPDGSVYHWTKGCCDAKLVAVDKWQTLRDQGNEYGWVIHPGYNSVTIETNACCCDTACAYIELDPITM